MVLERVLVRQAGVVTLAQARACGISADTVRRRVRAGAWRELHPCVYLVGGHRLTDEARVRAAWMWARAARAVVTGPAAAYWHGMMDRAPAAVELTLPRAVHRKSRPGIGLRRRDLRPDDVVERREVTVADAPLAALETALVVPRGSVFLDRALQRHVRFPAVYRCYCRNIGRHGSAGMHRLLVAAADRADPAAERLLVTLLRRAGIGGWVLGYPFGPYRIDLAFPVERVAIEVDGWAWHIDAERFRTDRRKGNSLTRGGWDLLRFPWHTLDGEPAACIAEVEATLALARRRPA
ncbi:very-short-patch-repair endonuclease [Pseudonocardia hierapolitana]|uniref:Very-short-patch-repair endonuclease n=1 Tax=Pseudonocardia hierapolitana TaxID=1128676 RepID=A0A561SI71_9PSEU|nr:type IV toxin-antitoxin system AbiEi family antitoxin domain-containing protein [Pseudonocardia hierapolitana]TWF74505.1 very-short-patch-repair endonuclease [Pseudonocardia hierapolitana]